MQYQFKTSQNEKRLVKVDLLKFVLIFSVCFLHLGADQLDPLTRIGVSGFLAIAGYYSYYGNAKPYKKLGKKIIRTITFYVIAVIVSITAQSLIYINSEIQHWNDVAMKFQNWQTLFSYILLNRPIISGIGIWFLLCLIYVYAIHYLFVMLNINKLYKFIFPLILFAGIFIQLYFGKDYNDTGITITQTWLIVGFGFFGLGYTIHEFKDKLQKIGKTTIISSTLIFFALQIVENYIYIFTGIMGKSSHSYCYYVSTIGCIFFLIIWMSTWKPSWFKFTNAYYQVCIPNISFLIYILHMYIGQNMMGIVRGPNWMNIVWTCIAFLITLILSMAISMPYIGITNTIKQNKALKLNKVNTKKLR